MLLPHADPTIVATCHLHAHESLVKVAEHTSVADCRLAARGAGMAQQLHTAAPSGCCALPHLTLRNTIFDADECSASIRADPKSVEGCEWDAQHLALTAAALTIWHLTTSLARTAVLWSLQTDCRWLLQQAQSFWRGFRAI
jgi:hypothetical protein